MKEKIGASKEVYKILSKFDSDQICEILARTLNKVLRSAPNKEAQIDYLEQLAGLTVEKLQGPNPFEKIVYQEKGSDVVEEVNYDDFEVLYEELSHNALQETEPKQK